MNMNISAFIRKIKVALLVQKQAIAISMLMILTNRAQTKIHQNAIEWSWREVLTEATLRKRWPQQKVDHIKCEA